MQNVLVDDRRIWVDLYELLLMHISRLIHSIALNPLLDSILLGQITQEWALGEREVALVGLVAEMISRKHGSTEWMKGMVVVAITTVMFSIRAM